MPISYKGMYPTPIDDQPGAGRDQKNIDFWSRRASRNSDGDQHRAKSAMRLPDNGGRAHAHSTSAPPRHDPAVDAALVGGDAFSSRIPD